MFEARTAPSAAELAAQPYQAVGNGASIPNAIGNTDQWLQIRGTYSRTIPAWPGAQLDIWLGSSSVAFTRTFARPTIYSISATFE
jgi:hypothetical protein